MKIQMIKRSQLVVSTVNHRQSVNGITTNRKVQGTVWQEGFRPLVVAAMVENKYLICDGNCRYEILRDTDVFPCIVVNVPVSTEAEQAAAIEKYKGDSLALSLTEICKFGTDKINWNSGKYIGADGETNFLTDMLPLYEDYHPCSIGSAEPDNKKERQRLKNFHKGLNQSVYRACILQGQYMDDYLNKRKGTSEALREAFKSAKKALDSGLPLADARAQALPTYNEFYDVAEQQKNDEPQTDRRLAEAITSIANAPIEQSRKDFVLHILVEIQNNNIASIVKELAQ